MTSAAGSSDSNDQFLSELQRSEIATWHDGSVPTLAYLSAAN